MRYAFWEEKEMKRIVTKEDYIQSLKDLHQVVYYNGKRVENVIVTLYGQIRIFMVMARDGLLPNAFSKVHPVHKTPHLCTWITGIATAVIAGLFPLPMIIDLCNIGTLFAFVLVSVGVIVLRKTRPEVERKFKTPGVPFTPLITVVFCFYLMYSLPKITWIRFGIWLLAGLLIYFLYSVRHSKLQVRPAK